MFSKDLHSKTGFLEERVNRNNVFQFPEYKHEGTSMGDTCSIKLEMKKIIPLQNRTVFPAFYINNFCATSFFISLLSFLTHSQRSPGFYMSAVQVFLKHWRKTRNGS